MTHCETPVSFLLPPGCRFIEAKRNNNKQCNKDDKDFLDKSKQQENIMFLTTVVSLFPVLGK